MYWTDLFERYVENGRQNVCRHYSQKVPSSSLPSSPGWWYVCWWAGRMWDWDWAPNPPLPKRLTAAPVRIKPVPRSLLSIHSAIVDLQFVFFALAYLCFMFACVSMFSRSNQSYPSLPIYSFSMDKYSVLFLLLSDLEKYICLTFLRFTWVSWMRHCSLHINHIYLASFLIIGFWHFLVIRFWYFSTHYYYRLDPKSWSF